MSQVQARTVLAIFLLDVRLFVEVKKSINFFLLWVADMRGARHFCGQPSVFCHATTVHKRDLTLLKVEKMQLLNRVSVCEQEAHENQRKWKEATAVGEKALADLEIEKQNSICEICMSSNRDTVIMPCMHFMFCYECLSKMQQQQQNKCPACRTPISGLLKCKLNV